MGTSSFAPGAGCAGALRENSRLHTSLFVGTRNDLVCAGVSEQNSAPYCKSAGVQYLLVDDTSHSTAEAAIRVGSPVVATLLL